MITLVRRAGPSVVMSLCSPVIAIGLTLLAGALLFAAMGRAPGEALWVYFLSPFSDAYSRAELVV
ncbi:MAG: ABC transporter permease, partial [Pseudomonadota bacterium]